MAPPTKKAKVIAIQAPVSGSVNPRSVLRLKETWSIDVIEKARASTTLTPTEKKDLLYLTKSASQHPMADAGLFFGFCTPARNKPAHRLPQAVVQSALRGGAFLTICPEKLLLHIAGAFGDDVTPAQCRAVFAHHKQSVSCNESRSMFDIDDQTGSLPDITEGMFGRIATTLEIGFQNVPTKKQVTFDRLLQWVIFQHLRFLISALADRCIQVSVITQDGLLIDRMLSDEELEAVGAFIPTLITQKPWPLTNAPSFACKQKPTKKRPGSDQTVVAKKDEISSISWLPTGKQIEFYNQGAVMELSAWSRLDPDLRDFANAISDPKRRFSSKVDYENGDIGYGNMPGWLFRLLAPRDMRLLVTKSYDWCDNVGDDKAEKVREALRVFFSDVLTPSFVQLCCPRPEGLLIIGNTDYDPLDEYLDAISDHVYGFTGGDNDGGIRIEFTFNEISPNPSDPSPREGPGCVISQRNLLTPSMLRPWQKQVYDMVMGPKDSRTVSWYFDWDGNIGKSMLLKMLCCDRHLRVCHVDGKASDIACLVLDAVENGGLDLVVFDIPRTSIHRLKTLYGVMETMKNGSFFSGKYKPGQVCINHPHVLVFANVPPDWDTLSRDRYGDINMVQNGTAIKVEYPSAAALTILDADGWTKEQLAPYAMDIIQGIRRHIDANYSDITPEDYACCLVGDIVDSDTFPNSLARLQINIRRAARHIQGILPEKPAWKWLIEASDW